MNTVDVLLIEDNPGDAVLVREMLADARPWKFALHWAASLADGLARLQESRPGVVLLDLSLPDSQGLGTLGRIRQAMPDLPVVVLTGLHDDATGLAAVHAGAQDFLVKGDVEGQLLGRSIRYAIERKQAELAAARAQARLAEAIDNVPGPFVLWDEADRLVTCNAQARRFYGDATGEVMVSGCRYQDLLRHGLATGLDEVPVSLREAWVAERMEQHRSAAAATERRLPDGRWVRIEERRIGEGGVVGIGVDITELKNREASLQAATASAEEANRAKTQLLAAVSHDLRQPLHAMGLFCSALSDRVRGDKSRELVRNIEASLESMNRLFGTVLDSSRLDAGVLQAHPQDVALAPLMARLGASFSLQAERRRLKFRLRPLDVQVHTDPALLERILGNFLSNALRYTESGGVLLAARHRDGRVRIEVWDTGVGIAPEHREAIFREYFQVSVRTGKGLGLGLNIALRLGQLLNLPLSLCSRPGQGSCFAIELPPAVSPAAAPSDPLAALGLGGVSLEGRRILVVDDDPKVLAAMAALLETLGCTVTQAPDGATAAAAWDPRQPWDAVVADFRLKEDELGPEVVARLRRLAGRPLPAMIVTAEAAPEALAAVKASGLPLLYKPVHAANLATLLRHLLRQAPTGS